MMCFSDIRLHDRVERGHPPLQYLRNGCPHSRTHMAVFGAPLDDPMHADHAVETALAMVEELQRLNRKWAAEGRPQLDIGIGINTGPMIAGNIGSDQIMSYTVIGDAVNLGSRLESLNKQYGTRIIISDDTRSRLAGAFRFRPLGEVVVKGKTQPVTILQVIDAPSRPAGLKPSTLGLVIVASCRPIVARAQARQPASPIQEARN